MAIFFKTLTRIYKAIQSDFLRSFYSFDHHRWYTNVRRWFFDHPLAECRNHEKKKKKQWKWRNSERFEEGRGGEDQRVEPGLPHSSVVGVPCQWMACSTYRKNGIVKFAMFWVLPCLLVWRFPSGLSKIFSFVCLMCWQISLCQLRQSCFQVQLVC